MHRCLEWQGISRLPEVEGDKPRKKRFDIYPNRLLPYRSGRSENGRRQALPSWPSTGPRSSLWSNSLKRPICRPPLPSSKHSSEPFRIASTPCSPTTESSSPICRRTVEGLRQDGVDIPSIASRFVMASATVLP